MNMQTFTAAHRLGLAEPDLRAVDADPLGWVLAQLDTPDLLDSGGMLGSAQAMRQTRQVLQAARTQDADAAQARRQLRQASLSALTRRWTHQAQTRTPVYERYVMVWANHFTVAATKGTTQALVLPFELEAIRPHALGRFQDLLRAVVTHPAMLLYLDNAQSIGPHSRAGLRRSKGLNENLARELLELHTLGVGAGYTQADVSALAALLTGWTVARDGDGNTQFVAAMHEPGDKWVLGQRYAEGPQALDAVLAALVRHPATAQHVATRLVRDWVDPTAPAHLVQPVARAFQDTGGDLRATAHALITQALSGQALAPRARRPEELLLAWHRVSGVPVRDSGASVAALTAMGQPWGRTPSPAGWPFGNDDWLGPDALLKRAQWAHETGRRFGATVDARALAQAAWGQALHPGTARELNRAESPAQALALLLASPEFTWC